jgi:hypothetical protein
MIEAYAIFTTSTDFYDRPGPVLFGLYATAEKAESDAAMLRDRMEDADVANYVGEPLYSLVTVENVPIRY